MSRIEFWLYSFFFFSSRRRHTRLQGDWSSDVCSSDLARRVGSPWVEHDSRSAVLDPWCRFAGVHNLFVVDGSFMPTSGGVNPSLTIAANALRVARCIVEAL